MDGNLAYIAAVAGIGSALGGLIGTLATMAVARKQIQATVTTTQQQMHTAVTLAEKDIHARVVLAERMRWIANLRDSIAEYLGGLQLLLTFVLSAKRTQPVNTLTSNEQVLTTKTLVLRSKIELLLNPHEEDHQQLMMAITELGEHAVQVVKRNVAPERPEAELVAQVRAVAQTILKREWERVKRGK